MIYEYRAYTCLPGRLPALLDRLLKDTNYANLYDKEDPDDLARLENIEEFLSAAMAELASDSNELKVAGAKFLYAGGISEKFEATFAAMNR